jgi:two-component system cell cycle sensor histidine kinase/response regulator CckA
VSKSAVSPALSIHDFEIRDALLSLFHSVQEGVFIGCLESDDVLKTLAANPYLKLMFGYEPTSPDSTIQPFNQKHFADAKARRAFVDQLIRDGSVIDYLLRLRRKDNTLIWVEITARLDSASENKTRYINALLRDVSERRKLEDQGRDVHHQLLQAEKLAALGQTVSGVAHELNNPLATILTWSERLAGQATDPTTKRGLNTILSESERAAKIVRNLLTFSRKRNTTRSLVHVNQIVRETLSLRAYDQRASNISTIEGLAAGLPQVFADSHHLKQVLLNLIINAEQAMLSTNGRGILIVRSWHDAEKDLVIIEVNDDGPGVPEDVQSKIFNPFFTTKSVGKGTGLGLTVAHALIQDHGGQIRVVSPSNNGTSFYIDLPTGTNLPKPVNSPERQEPSLTVGAGAQVLVIDDEIALAEAISAALVDAGFIVTLASNGEEALTKTAQRPYDLIICDLKMPRVDGPTFYRRVTETTPSLATHFIFVTGDVAGTDAEPFLAETGCRWLAKPFRLKDLLSLVREVVG